MLGLLFYEIVYPKMLLWVRFSFVDTFCVVM